jgi:hypothetical protein
MVRLRRNRWYSAEGQSRVRASVATQALGTRRVLSLCFLLALVIVMMQKVSDPKHVRNAFSALGVPFEREVIASTADDSVTAGSGSQSAMVPKATATEALDEKWVNTCKDLVPRLLADLTTPQLLDLSERWFAVSPVASSSSSSKELQRVGEQAKQQLTSLAGQLGELTESERSEWQEQLNRFQKQWQWFWPAIVSGQPTADVDPSLANAMSDFLDSKLTLQMRDAAPWSPKETVPFLRLLQRGQSRTSTTAPANPPLLSTLQLEAELSVYRGQPIRFRGEVRRAEYVQRESNAFGILGYWSLWLRGADGAAQPVAVYSTHSIGKQLAAVLDQEQFPNVEVMGVVGKRLAYASQEGVEVAPTIFATSLLQFAQEAPPIAAVPDDELVSKLAWAGLLAILVAGIVLAPILANRRTTSRKVTRKPIDRGGAAGAVLLLASVLPTQVLSQAHDDQQTDSVPPWAQTDGQDLIREMLTERIRAAFTASDVASLNRYLDGDFARIPDPFLKSMQRLRQLGWARVLNEAWEFDLPDAGLQVKNAELTGQVRLAMPVKLSEDQQLWFQKEPGDHLFRLEVVGEDTELHTVFCETVPAQWMQSVQLKQPVVIQGLSLLAAGDESHAMCWFARSPQWLLPANVPASDWLPALEPQLYQLGVLGWDLANADIVRASSQKAIQAQESPAYFSLMRILASKPQLTSKKATAMQALAKSVEELGSPVEWSVRLVSGSVVDVSSNENRKQLGADHYYQFDGFVDIGNQVVHYKTGTGGEKKVVDFEKEFPVTIVMQAESPFVSDRVKQGDTKSWEIGKYVTVSGVFFRLWSYESELMEKNSETARQAAPLVVAYAMTPSAPRIRQSQASVGWFGYALCLATLAILGGILFSVLRPEPRIRRR